MAGVRASKAKKMDKKTSAKTTRTVKGRNKPEKVSRQDSKKKRPHTARGKAPLGKQKKSGE